MKRPLIVLTVSLLLTALVAGCHEPTTDPDNDNGGSDGGDGGDALAVTLEVLDPPTIVDANESFDVTVRVTSNRALDSTHAGAHYSANASSEDTEPAQYTTVLTLVSPHGNATVPGEYTIQNWTIAEEHAGKTIYYRAHIILDGQPFWSDEMSFLVNPLS